MLDQYVDLCEKRAMSSCDMPMVEVDAVAVEERDDPRPLAWTSVRGSGWYGREQKAFVDCLSVLAFCAVPVCRQLVWLGWRVTLWRTAGSVQARMIAVEVAMGMNLMRLIRCVV